MRNVGKMGATLVAVFFLGLALPVSAQNDFSVWIAKNYSVKRVVAEYITNLELMKSVDTLTDKELSGLRVSRKELPLIKQELVATLLRLNDTDIEPMLLESAFRGNKILVSLQGPEAEEYAESGFEKKEIENAVKEGLAKFVYATGIHVLLPLGKNSRENADVHLRIRRLVFKDTSFLNGALMKGVKMGAGEYEIDSSRSNLNVATAPHQCLGHYFPSRMKGLVHVDLYPFPMIFSHMKGRSVDERLADYLSTIPRAVYHELIHAVCFYGNMSQKKKQGHSLNPQSAMYAEQKVLGFKRKINNGSTLLGSESIFFERHGYDYTREAWHAEKDISAKAVRVLLAVYRCH